MMWFDLAAHRAACAYLEKHCPLVVDLLSEEASASLRLGTGKPEFTVVLDPVDGSENFARGIPVASAAIALIPTGEPISTANVQFSLIGDLVSGRSWVAARGLGTFDNRGVRLSTSAITNLRDAIVSCDLSKHVISPSLASVISLAKSVRLFGSAAWSIAMLATGAFDAHVDIRGMLTAESFLASSLVLSEAGGIITDPVGRPLHTVERLTDTYSILAASNHELLASLVQQIVIGSQ